MTGLAIQPDARLRERLNWDGGIPYDAFPALWGRTMRDRDWVPVLDGLVGEEGEAVIDGPGVDEAHGFGERCGQAACQ